MGYPMGWSQDELIMFLRACLAFWMLPRSGFRFLRNTSSCCCPAHSPRTHSLFTCSTTESSYRGLGRVSANPCPAAHLDDAEAEVPPVQHDDLVLVGAFVQDVAQGEQGRGIGQDGAPPGRVALVSDDQVLLVGGDGLIKHGRLVVLVGGREVVLTERRRTYDPSPPEAGEQNQLVAPPHLVKLQGHSDSRNHDFPEQLHVGEDPLVSHGGDAEVSFEQGVKAVQERLQIAAKQEPDQQNIIRTFILVQF